MTTYYYFLTCFVKEEKEKEEILFNLIRVFQVSFFQNRPYWKAHRGGKKKKKKKKTV